nr:uncharacterized protein LOC113695728 [Coffea arabica]XP_027070666.1 uncharacterized protein LOC113695728 [Coffea arabica]
MGVVVLQVVFSVLKVTVLAAFLAFQGSSGYSLPPSPSTFPVFSPGGDAIAAPPTPAGLPNGAFVDPPLLLPPLNSASAPQKVLKPQHHEHLHQEYLHKVHQLAYHLYRNPFLQNLLKVGLPKLLLWQLPQHPTHMHQREHHKIHCPLGYHHPFFLLDCPQASHQGTHYLFHQHYPKNLLPLRQSLIQLLHHLLLPHHQMEQAPSSRL